MPAKYADIDPSPFSANRRILEMIGRPPRVLDVGCSTGYIAAELAARGCEVYGIEKDAEAVAQAARHCKRVWAADLDELPNLDLRLLVDAIICADVLEHTRDPEANLRRLLAHLAPDGRVICSLPNIANWRIRLALLAGRFDYTETGILDQSHLRFFTLRSARRMFDRLGLKVTHMTVTPSFTPYRLYRIYPLKWIDYALCRLLPRLGAQQFVFVLTLARQD